MTDQAPSKEKVADAHLEETAIDVMKLVNSRPHPREYGGYIFDSANGPRWKIDRSAQREQYLRDSVAYWRKLAESSHEPRDDAEPLVDELVAAAMLYEQRRNNDGFGAASLRYVKARNAVLDACRASQPPGALLQAIDTILAKAEVNPISASHVSVPRELVGRLRVERDALTKESAP
jgi:hypothetical protein